MQVLLLIVLSISVEFLPSVLSASQGDFIGCFQQTPNFQQKIKLGILQECFEFCESSYHRYSAITPDYCTCKNTLLSELPNDSCGSFCKDDSGLSCGGSVAASYYDTGVFSEFKNIIFSEFLLEIN